jgi:hypothetical protein
MMQEPNEEGERKTRALIVRNTADQLRSTTMRTFFDWFKPGVWGHYKVTDRTFYMKHSLPDGTKLNAEFSFLPLDTPDDVRKALSLELTFLFCNEWRELHPEVIDGLLMRLRRYPSMREGGHTRSCAIFDTNPPDMDTWHFHQMEDPPANWAVFKQPPGILSHEEWVAQEGSDPEELEGTPDARGTLWWVNPKADNIKNLDPRYYPEIVPGKTEDFINVYLRAQYGRSLAGLPVYDKTFNVEYHIAKTPFTPLKSKEYPIVIGQDFGRCYDDQTEVLTKQGWKFFADVDPLEEVATLDPVSRELTYVVPNFKVEYDYTGDMLEWSGTNINLCVTPEHRFPYTNRSTPDIVRWAAAQELSECLTSHKYALVAPRQWVGEALQDVPCGLDPEVYAGFLGWWMADGLVERGTSRVMVNQTKPAPELEALMRSVTTKLGVPLCEHTGWAFSHQAFADHLRAFGPKHGGGRRVPDRIRMAPREVIAAFVAGYTGGDGHVRAPRRPGGSEEHTIWFESKELAGQFQDLAQKLGWGSSVRWQVGGTSTFSDGREVTCAGGWVVHFKKNWERVELLPSQFRRVPYAGKIYCLNVPFHTLCVRRNGKVSWNGNTPAATLVQRNAFGQVIVLAEVTSENMGIEVFLDRKLRPLLSEERFAGCHYIMAPDPAGWAKQQIGEISPVDVLRRAGFQVVRPVTNDPERRIQAVERVLTANTDGRPTFVVNPECEKLLRGFRYGYRYKLNRNGTQDQAPVKNEYSHIHDALQYAILVAEGNQQLGQYIQGGGRREVKVVPYAWA